MIFPILVLAPLLVMHILVKSDEDVDGQSALGTISKEPAPSLFDRFQSWLVNLIPFIAGWSLLALSWWFCYSAYEIPKTALRCSYQIDSVRNANKKAVWAIYHPVEDTVRFTDFCLSLPIRDQQPAEDDVAVPMTIPKVTNDKKIP